MERRLVNAWLTFEKVAGRRPCLATLTEGRFHYEFNILHGRHGESSLPKIGGILRSEGQVKQGRIAL